MMRIAVLLAVVGCSSALQISATKELATASRPVTRLPTPAAYNELLARKAGEADAVSVIRFSSPFCRACREPSPLLERLDAPEDVSVYSVELVRDGKAAGKRMLKFFKERGVG